MIFLIVTAYILCSILVIGISLADMQASAPSMADKFYRKDLGISCFVGLFGPVGLIVLLFATGFAEHGIQFKRKPE